MRRSIGVVAVLVLAGCSMEFTGPAGGGGDWCLATCGGTIPGDFTYTLPKPTVDSLPRPVPNLPVNVSSLSLGSDHACALTADGDVWCWGDNRNGRAGFSLPRSEAAGRVLTGARAVSAGGSMSCALDRSGRPLCWGFGVGDQSCDVPGSGFVCAWKAVAIDSTLQLATLSVGAETACGISEDGRLYCWGSDADHLKGEGPADEARNVTPTLRFPDVRFRDVTVGSAIACAITQSAEVVCWGAGSPILQRVSMSAARRITGYRLFCAGTPGAEVSCFQQGGDPTRIPLAFDQFSAGETHACGVVGDGRAFCWGADSYGNLGGGYPSSGSTQEPRPVGGDLLFSSVDAGRLTTCGVTTAGVGVCWGRRLGN